MIFPHIFVLIGSLFRFAKFKSENAIGPKSEAQKSDRIGNGLSFLDRLVQLKKIIGIL